MFYFFLDFLIYNYTPIKSCFFLLSYFEKKDNLLYKFLIISLFDILIIHSNFIFPFIYLFLYWINKNIKFSYYNLSFTILRLIILYLIYQFLIYLFFRNLVLNIAGFLLILIYILICTKKNCNS